MFFDRKRHSGFTLAELLIALAILGVIATFTIPKIITAQTNGKYNATAHEAASMISGAFVIYQNNNTVTSSTTPGALTQYMNYLSVNTSSLIDQGARDCSSTISYICLNTHSGGVLFMEKGVSFGGTNTTNAHWYAYDPDPTQNKPALNLFLYYNGRVTSRSGISPNAVTSNFTFTPTSDPSWFQW